MSVLIVTGTGTDVGKTVATAALAATLPGTVAVVKPAQTGVADGEAGDLAEVTRLSEVIDDHVVTLNGLRADVARRLAHLDELRSAADDANLGAFLDDTIQPQLPQQSEDFPDRIYGS